RGRRAKKPEYEVVEAVAPEPAVEGEEALETVEGDAEPVAAADDETFLEEEEDQGSDVSGIISGGVAEEGEEQ
ncbi:MAG TPA: TIGR02300 family protein, partial [Hyphomicrobiaceae bacterium]|nr:TIGR02300 family protein [Hyphomicrobiaceae bacterium]